MYQEIGAYILPAKLTFSPLTIYCMFAFHAFPVLHKELLLKRVMQIHLIHNVSYASLLLFIHALPVESIPASFDRRWVLNTAGRHGRSSRRHRELWGAVSCGPVGSRFLLCSVRTSTPPTLHRGEDTHHCTAAAAAVWETAHAACTAWEQTAVAHSLKEIIDFLLHGPFFFYYSQQTFSLIIASKEKNTDVINSFTDGCVLCSSQHWADMQEGRDPSHVIRYRRWFHSLMWDLKTAFETINTCSLQTVHRLYRIKWHTNVVSFLSLLDTKSPTTQFNTPRCLYDAQ